MNFPIQLSFIVIEALVIWALFKAQSSVRQKLIFAVGLTAFSWMLLERKPYRPIRIAGAAPDQFFDVMTLAGIVACGLFLVPLIRSVIRLRREKQSWKAIVERAHWYFELTIINMMAVGSINFAGNMTTPILVGGLAALNLAYVRVRGLHRFGFAVLVGSCLFTSSLNDLGYTNFRDPNAGPQSLYTPPKPNAEAIELVKKHFRFRHYMDSRHPDILKAKPMEITAALKQIMDELTVKDFSTPAMWTKQTKIVTINQAAPGEYVLPQALSHGNRKINKIVADFSRDQIFGLPGVVDTSGRNFFVVDMKTGEFDWLTLPTLTYDFKFAGVDEKSGNVYLYKGDIQKKRQLFVYSHDGNFREVATPFEFTSLLLTYSEKRGGLFLLVDGIQLMSVDSELRATEILGLHRRYGPPLQFKASAFAAAGEGFVVEGCESNPDVQFDHCQSSIFSVNRTGELRPIQPKEMHVTEAKWTTNPPRTPAAEEH